MLNEYEKIRDIEQEIEELEYQRQRLEYEEQIKEIVAKKQLRKERTKRLIETGALCEKYFEIENLDIDEREQLFKFFSKFIIQNKEKCKKNRSQ